MSGTGPKDVGESFWGSITNLLKELGFGKEGSELGWDGGFVGPKFAGGGMGEPQTPSVQHESSGVEILPAEISVDRISEQWASKVFQMHADLVRPTGVEVAKDKPPGRFLASSENVVVGDGGFAGCSSRVEHGLFLPVDGMAADVSED